GWGILRATSTRAPCSDSVSLTTWWTIRTCGARSASLFVTRLVDFLRGHNWIVRMSDGKISTTFLGRGDQILSFLQVGRHVNPNRFSTVYDIDRILLSAGMLAPLGIDVASDDSYFKFNLDYINLYNLIRLESSSVKAMYQKGYDIVRNHTSQHHNAL